MWKREPGAWTVIPLDREPPLFALVAADSEGERRGREVIAAFVGPAVGRLADTPLALSSAALADVVLSRHGISNVIPLIPEPGKDSSGPAGCPGTAGVGPVDTARDPARGCPGPAVPAP